MWVISYDFSFECQNSLVFLTFLTRSSFQRHHWSTINRRAKEDEIANIQNQFTFASWFIFISHFLFLYDSTQQFCTRVHWLEDSINMRAMLWFHQNQIDTHTTTIGPMEMLMLSSRLTTRNRKMSKSRMTRPPPNAPSQMSSTNIRHPARVNITRKSVIWTSMLNGRTTSSPLMGHRPLTRLHHHRLQFLKNQQQ